MIKKIEFRCTPEQAKDTFYLKNRIRKELNLSNLKFDFKWSRRSIDARRRKIKFNCVFDVNINGFGFKKQNLFSPKNVSKSKTCQ